MRWSRAGIESLLRIRTGLQDGRFEEAFEHWNASLLTYRLQKRHPQPLAA